MSTATDSPTDSPTGFPADSRSGSPVGSPAPDRSPAPEHLEPGQGPVTQAGPALTAELRAHLDGPFGEVREHCRALDAATFGPPSAPLPMDEHRSRVTAQLAALAAEPYAARGFPEHQGGTARYGEAVAAFEMLGHTDLSLFVKAGVQWGLFGGAVSLLGTSRHDHLLPRITSGELQGCFAMTETGHGSDVQSLLTTATFDRRPTRSSSTRPCPRHARTTSATRPARSPRGGLRAARRRRRVPAACTAAPRPDPRRVRHSRKGCHHRGLRPEARSRRRRQRTAALRPRPGAAHQPARPLRRRRRRRHLHEPHPAARPPLLHHARHARPRSHLGGRRSGRCRPLGGRRHERRMPPGAASSPPPAPRRRRPSSTTGPTSGACCRGSRRLRPPARPQRPTASPPWTTCSPGARRREEDQRRLETRAAGIKVLTTRHATDTIQEMPRAVRRSRLPLGQPPRRAQGRHRHLHDLRGRQHRPAPARRQVAPR